MSTPTLTDEDRAEIRSILEEVARIEDMRGVHTRLASRAMEMLPRLSLREKALEERRGSAPGRRRGESVSTMRRRVRGEVQARAGGQCEFRSPATGARCVGPSLIWDHFWGRGKDETAEGSWMLCGTHDREKTRNDGGRYVWVMSFREHCIARGLDGQIEKCRQAAALEKGQFPGRTVEEVDEP